MKKVFSKQKPGEILDFINGEIRRRKLKKSEENRACLMSEETLMTLVEHATEDEITVNISYFGGTLRIKLISKGEPFDPLAVSGSDPFREALVRSFADDIHTKHQKNVNTITITAYKSRYLLLYKLIAGGLAGIILSFLLKAIIPAGACQWIAEQIMDSGQTLFMNCLNMLIPPLVFFSIASAICGFGNISQLGRIGGKIMGIYMMTTLCATIFGFVMVEIFKPYKFGSIVLGESASLQAGVHLSFKESFLNIIPDNFVKAFLEGDTIQIIFLAVIIGIAITAVGDKAKPLQAFINAGNEVFLKMTNGLVGFMPLLIFCIVSKTILAGGNGSGGMGAPIAAGVGVYLATIVVMIVFYHLLLLFLGRLKPLTFTKKYLPYILQVVGTGSSSAAIPLNMKVCSDLGIDKRVYSLSIPLGATVNMDGTTIYMSVFGLLLARLYGMPINLPVYFTMTFAIFMLSAGAPPVVGSSIICLSALLRTLGLPVTEAIAMVLGIEVIAGLLRTANNAVCDMVGSLIVANQEGLLDKEKYYSKN